MRGGEIVALAGLVGAGRSEVVRAVFGIDRYDAGEVRVDGRPAARRGRPAAAIAAGLALVPEDRRQQGLVMELSVERNATLTRRWPLSRFGLLRGGAERRAARDWTRRLQVKAAQLTDPVSTLSGGNQQKVVLAKWLSTTPRVLIVDEPTRGIDVGTKAEVHRLMSQLAADGVAVLMVSSELPEVLGMADRVLVMHEGRLVADISREQADEESVMLRRRRARDDRGRRAQGACHPQLEDRPRGRHRGRAGPAARRDRGPQSRLPGRAEHPRPAARRDHPGGARGRPDDGGDHPQRRPVGRLDRRADRVRHRQAVHRQRPACRSCSPCWPGSRWARCAARSTAAWSLRPRCPPW